MNAVVSGTLIGASTAKPAGAGCAAVRGVMGKGQRWVYPSGHFPGNEHTGTQSLGPQLTHFLPSPTVLLTPALASHHKASHQEPHSHSPGLS